MRTWITWLLVGLSLALVARAGWAFPWESMFDVLLNARPVLLAAAVLVNLSALAAKGWAWHILLQPVAPHRWRTAQEANLAGAALNNLSVAVVGEAARIRLMIVREGVPAGTAIASVVWTRAVEAVALAIFVLIAPAFLELPTVLRGVQLGTLLVLGAVFLFAYMRGWLRLAASLPPSLRGGLATLTAIGSWHRLPAPIALGLFNWAAQWATYHLTLVASGISTSFAASFTALLAANLGGLLRLTPANVGLMQASMVAGLLPFGVPAERAVAASLLLQGLQVVPLLALSVALFGWRGISQLRAEAVKPRTVALPIDPMPGPAGSR